MPDDWVQKYLSRDREEKTAELRKAELARAAADTFFRALYSRVKKDVDAFEAAENAGLREQFIPSRSFVVRRGEFPAFHLEVSRDEIYIRYKCIFTPDHASPSDLPPFSVPIIM